MFLTLHEARPYGEVPQPITFNDLYAWSRLTNIRLTLHEVTAVRAVDNAWLKWANSKKD